MTRLRWWWRRQWADVDWRGSLTAPWSYYPLTERELLAWADAFALEPDPS